MARRQTASGDAGPGPTGATMSDRMPPTSLTRRATTLLLAATLALGAAACSGSDDADSADTTPVTPAPEDPRSECPDPTGDMEDVGLAPGSPTLSEPAGSDLVDATVEVTDDTVDVSITVAGDPNAPTNPILVVFRGLAAQQGGFEIQALPAGDGTWEVELVEYLTNVGKRVPLSAPVTVEGSTVTYSVPRSDLPPLSATRLWSFGSSSGDPAAGVTRVSDLCSPLETETEAEAEADGSTTTAG